MEQLFIIFEQIHKNLAYSLQVTFHIPALARLFT